MLPAKGNGDLHEEDCIVLTGEAADVCGQKLNVELSHVITLLGVLSGLS